MNLILDSGSWRWTKPKNSPGHTPAHHNPLQIILIYIHHICILYYCLLNYTHRTSALSFAWNRYFYIAKAAQFIWINQHFLWVYGCRRWRFGSFTDVSAVMRRRWCEIFICKDTNYFQWEQCMRIISINRKFMCPCVFLVFCLKIWVYIYINV